MEIGAKTSMTSESSARRTRAAGLARRGLAASLGTALLSACQSAGPSTGLSSPPRATASVGADSDHGSAGASAGSIGSDALAQPDSPRARTTPASGLVAIADGDAIEFDSVRAALVERAGAQVLRDALVDARLARRLRGAAISIDDTAVARERALLLETLSSDPARATELLGAIRRREGLGPQRFEALLRRNAGLRALVAPSVAIDDEGLRNAFDMLHGAKRVARVAVLSSLADAERFAADVRAGGDFAKLATERSLDEGAARGGLLAPVARRDPSYPEALRAAIYATELGKASNPILDAGRFLVTMPIEETPADGVAPEAARDECARMLRISRERLLMDALARELSSLDGVTIFDRGFDGARP
jgi:hypothetical protein